MLEIKSGQKLQYAADYWDGEFRGVTKLKRQNIHFFLLFMIIIFLRKQLWKKEEKKKKKRIYLRKLVHILNVFDLF